MPQDAAQIRERIISIIRDNGPSLPVQIAKETGLSILFASAFLSELFGDKAIRMSNLRIGSSPLYFLLGQEPQLEKFSSYLKSKEKDAFILLKDKKILKDSELHPAIRVALREIKDFAVPFEKNDEILWRYFLIGEPSIIEIDSDINPTPEKEIIETELKPEEKSDDSEKEEIEISRAENISVREGGGELASEISNSKGIKEQISKKEILKKEKPQKKAKEESKSKKINKNEKKDDNFFNKIKEFLSEKGIEILDIKDFKNSEAILKVKKENHEELFFIFNKKRIAEKEFLDSNAKALEEGLPYSIIFLGEIPKKMNDLISAIKNLSEIYKIE